MANPAGKKYVAPKPVRQTAAGHPVVVNCHRCGGNEFLGMKQVGTIQTEGGQLGKILWNLRCGTGTCRTTTGAWLNEEQYKYIKEHQLVR